MTDRVDVAALRAIISRYRRAMIDRDAASACKRAGDMLDASHRAAEAARDMMNAAPALLDAADERDKLSADWDDAHSALCEVCSATDKDHDLPLRLSEMAETVVGWLKAAQAERDALRAENERLRKTVGRLHKITSDSYMLLPILPGDAMAFADGNLTPHVMRVADEFAVRTEQLAAERREVERLRAENEKLKGRDATAFFTGLRVIRSSLIERGTIIVNDQDMTDAGWPTAALAAQEHPHA